MSRAFGFASVFALGVVSMLAASPAAAVFNCYNPSICNCTVDCDKICGGSGPPDFVSYYCGDFGRCAGGDLCTGPAMTCSSTINGGVNGDTLTGNSNNERPLPAPRTTKKEQPASRPSPVPIVPWSAAVTHPCAVAPPSP